MPTVKDIVVEKPDEAQMRECKNWPVYTVEPSRFEWDHTQAETCLLVDGEVTIHDWPESGQSVSFGAGDFVKIPVDLRCTWEVKEQMKKHCDFS